MFLVVSYAFTLASSFLICFEFLKSTVTINKRLSEQDFWFKYCALRKILFGPPSLQFIYVCKHTGLVLPRKPSVLLQTDVGSLYCVNTTIHKPVSIENDCFLVCAWRKNVIEYLLSDAVRRMCFGILLFACGMLHSVASETGTLQHEVAARLSPFLGAGHTSPLAFPISLWCMDKVPFVWVVALGERAHSFETCLNDAIFISICPLRSLPYWTRPCLFLSLPRLFLLSRPCLATAWSECPLRLSSWYP